VGELDASVSLPHPRQSVTVYLLAVSEALLRRTAGECGPPWFLEVDRGVAWSLCSGTPFSFSTRRPRSTTVTARRPAITESGGWAHVFFFFVLEAPPPAQYAHQKECSRPKAEPVRPNRPGIAGPELAKSGIRSAGATEGWRRR